MAERTFPWFPVTFEIPSQNILWIGEAVHYDDDDKIVTIDDGYQGRMFFVGAVDVLNDNEIRWRSLTNDVPMQVRPTRPDDAIRWQHPGGIGVPLPTEIIGAIMSTAMPPPTIAAAVDDQGDVHTMILETAAGLYARYSGSWIRMADISPIEQLDIVDVPSADLDIYDQADQRGDQINIQFLHPINRPGLSAIDTTAPPPATTASAVAVATVVSAADIPEAIEFAQTHPDSRWYVQRRARALGYTSPFPWEEEQ